jgi:ubiquinone/menaquinone biosynthesis C-methylase UbiE
MQTQGFDLLESNPCLFYNALRLILKFVYHLLYHSFAWSYDLVAAIVSLGKWNDWIREVIPFVAGKRVLEIGFGPGHLQVELIRRGYHVFGVDESRQMIRQATHRIKSMHLNPHIVRGLAQEIPFQECFDTVIATFPSEYIVEPKTIREIYRVLKPGGKLVVLLSALPPRESFLYKIISKTFGVVLREEPNPMDSLLERSIQAYYDQGFPVQKNYLKQSTCTLILLEGGKPADASGAARLSLRE